MRVESVLLVCILNSQGVRCGRIKYPVNTRACGIMSYSAASDTGPCARAVFCNRPSHGLSSWEMSERVDLDIEIGMGDPSNPVSICIVLDVIVVARGSDPASNVASGRKR